MDIKKDLFKLFQETKDNYGLYEKIVKYSEEVITDTKGKENSEFYEIVVKLLDSINNAGCEERRNDQIKLLWKIQSQILDKYNKYLF